MAEQHEAEKQSIGDRAYDLAAKGILTAVVSVSTLGGAAVGGYAGYRLGEAISPDDFVGLGQAWMYVTEGIPAAVGAVVGAGIGVFTGTWLIDGDFDTCT